MIRLFFIVLVLFPLAACAEEAPSQEDIQNFADSVKSTIEKIWTPSGRYAAGPQVRTAFRPAVSAVTKATVIVRHKEQQVALGAVVGPDGWILTKASLLKTPLVCELADKRKLPAKLIGIHHNTDLAMLKVDATALPTVPWITRPAPSEGAWVATVGPEAQPRAVGVISVAPREIDKEPGVLGIQMDDLGSAARVVKVFPDSGAAAAGVQENDIIISINGTVTPTREDVRENVMSCGPGEDVRVGIRRGSEELIVTARLSRMARAFGFDPNRSSYQNSLGSELSERRAGFRAALQHDGVIEPEDCGGPLADLDGEVVGINIARAGRTESYAIPAAEARAVLADLMSGKLAPKE